MRVDIALIRDELAEKHCKEYNNSIKYTHGHGFDFREGFDVGFKIAFEKISELIASYDKKIALELIQEMIKDV